ncbi:MAG: Uma2 family endonuclease [Bacteroidota bacterium]
MNLLNLPYSPVMDEPRLYKLTVDQYIKMIDTGLFHPEEKVELVEGQLFCKGRIEELHAHCVNRLVNVLFRALTDTKFDISAQNPIRLENSRPEPDLVVQTKSSWETGGDPTAKDVLLIVEVAHSSLAFDREVKLSIYASSGIKHYWIVNLDLNQVEVYQGPSQGTYNDKRVFKPGEQVIVPLLNKKITVSDFLD